MEQELTFSEGQICHFLQLIYSIHCLVENQCFGLLRTGVCGPLGRVLSPSSLVLSPPPSGNALISPLSPSVPNRRLRLDVDGVPAASIPLTEAERRLLWQECLRLLSPRV